MTKDLTHGSPLKAILQFSLPVLFGMLLQQVYNLVDTMIVGHALGVQALGGVGSTGSLSFMIIGFCSGACAGFAIPVAQAFGARSEKMVRRYTAGGFWLCGGISLVLTAAVLVLCHPILTWMNTPPVQFDYAYSYIFIIFCGIPASFLYNFVAGVIRSLGDSRTPVYFLALSALLNIGLDLLLIYAVPLGVAGAAIATVISQLVSGVLCLIYMYAHFPILRMQKGEWRVRTHILGKLFLSGVPMGLQYSVTGIGSVMLQSAVNGLGPLYVSAVATAAKVNQLMYCPYEALGSASATFTGQNVGACQYHRVKRGIRSAILLGGIYVVLDVLTVAFGCRYIVRLFLRAEEVPIVLDRVWLFCLVTAAFGFLLVLVNVLRFSIQGMGFSLLSICSGVLEMIARGAMGAWLVPAFGFTMACFASPFAWALADLFLIPTFLLCLRRLRRQYLAHHPEGLPAET